MALGTRAPQLHGTVRIIPRNLQSGMKFGSVGDAEMPWPPKSSPSTSRRTSQLALTCGVKRMRMAKLNPDVAYGFPGMSWLLLVIIGTEFHILLTESRSRYGNVCPKTMTSVQLPRINIMKG